MIFQYLKKLGLAFSLVTALSLTKAEAKESRNLRENPQKSLLEEAIEYFEATEVPRIRSRFRWSYSINDSYQIERKARVQVILYNNGLIELPTNPGCFDRETVNAIKRLQKAHRIRPIDGTVGEATSKLISTLGEFELEKETNLLPDYSCRLPDTELIKEIQRNLMLLNYLPDVVSNGILDDETIFAIRNYKRGNTINDAETIDHALVSHLNMSSNERIRRLRDALRQHSRILGDSENHVYVNIPEFKFRYYYNGRLEFEMDLVVGAIRNNGSLSTKWHTNVQRGFINGLLINPWWNVPEGALEQEVRKDMEDDRKLRSRMQQLVNGRWIFDLENVTGRKFRHIPGPDNPLGRIAYDIHGGEGELIHDTPSRTLFRRAIREGSHGCMRANKPIEFALKLQELGFFSLGNIDDYINRIDDSTGFYLSDNIEFNRRIPVKVVYSLAWADYTKNGLVVFLPRDIYRYNRTIVVPGEDD